MNVKGKNIMSEWKGIPRKEEALRGVEVEGWTLANHEGTTHDRPITHM